MKPENRLSKNVTYVRLTDYIAAYMRSTHGGKILTFAPTDSYYTIMKNSLAKNEGFGRALSKYSYCAAAVDYAKAHPGYSTSIIGNMLEDLYLPTDDELKNLQAVYMPDTIYRGGQAIEPTSYYQMNRDGAQIFKRAAHDDFWTALILDIKRKSSAAVVRGEVPNKKVIIENFLTAHHIDLDCLENIYRSYSNHRKRLMFSTSEEYIPELDDNLC